MERAAFFERLGRASGDDIASLVRGIDLGADAVRIVSGRDWRDLADIIGVSVDPENTLESAGARLVKNVALTTRREAGDGAEIAALLAQAMMKRGLRKVEIGARPRFLQFGIDSAVSRALDRLGTLVRPLESESALERIAISYAQDERIGRLVARAIVAAGTRGGILVREVPAERQFDVRTLDEGAVVIDVPANPEGPGGDMKRRVEEALIATREAVDDGVIPGGGSSLLSVANTLGPFEGAEADELRSANALDDANDGIAVVRASLYEPVRARGRRPGVGIDELVRRGIVEPHKVTWTALKNAAQCASAIVGSVGTATIAPASSPITWYGGAKFLDDAYEARTAQIPVFLSAAGTGGSEPPIDAPHGESSSSDSSSSDSSNGSSSGSGGSPPGKQAPAERRVNVWLSDHDDPGTPLVVDHPYTLNVSIGKALARGNLASSVAAIAASDVPAAGLPTTWVFMSEQARFGMLTPGTTVDDTAANGAQHTARFALTIPGEGESAIVQLQLTPLVAGDIVIHALVYVRETELYREFQVNLSASNDAAPPGEARGATEPQPTLAQNEHVYVPLAHTGLRPPYEWTTPPAALAVTVMGQQALVNGTIGVKRLNGPVPWNVLTANVAASIDQVRTSAEKFRQIHEGYLNDIDPVQLESDMRNWQGIQDWPTLPNEADDDHRKRWEQVAVSPELRSLAYNGRALYQAFFPSKSDLRAVLDTAPPGLRLSFTWTTEAGPGYIPNVPWGLMYAFDPPPPGQPVDPTGFLALRFRLEYSSYPTAASLLDAPSKVLGGLDDVYRAHLLYWGAGGGDATAAEAAWQRQQWDTARNLVFLPPATGDPKGKLLSLLDTPVPQPTSILYFFCRCNVQNAIAVLDFGDGTSDTVRREDLSTRELPDRPLVFANACTTAAADPYMASELERSFFDRRCRAFLGTETKVPITFASRFAVVFFRFLYRMMGVPPLPLAPIAAGEAVVQTRLFFWRRYRNIGGLFYTYVNQYELFMADEPEVVGRQA